MSNTPRKILLAFSSFTAKGLMKEVFTQLDRKIRMDFAANETDILYYLSRHRAKLLPGLMIFDNPPVRPGLAEFVDNVHSDPPFKEIPIAFLLPPADIHVMKNWLRKAAVHFFPRPIMPSECKLYARQMMELYNDGVVVRTMV